VRLLNIIVANDYAYLEGGASKIALLQADGLRSRGHRVTLFSAQQSSDAPGNPDQRAADDGTLLLTGQWDIARDPERLRAVRQGLWNAAAYRMLADQLERSDRASTVVLVHSWNKALSSSIVRAATDRGVPVVAVLHDYSACCPNGAYHNFRSNQPCSLRPMSLRCLRTPCDQRSETHKAWRVVRQVVQQRRGGIPDQLSAVIYVSEYQRRAMQPWLPDTLSFQVLENPVAAPPEGLRAQVRDSARFLAVGRLSKEKGPLVLAQAARIAGVDVTFVGDGPLRGAIADANPDASFTGWLDGDAVWRELTRCRALVYPSMWRETFGLSVYEAAALGIPSIVSHGTAPADFIQHGVNGLLVPQGDADALADALRLLSDRPGYAAQLGAAASASWHQHSRSTERYFEQLEQILVGAMG